MPEKLANLREEIAFQYRKHCGSCTGSCCSLELEEEFVAFDWELSRFDKSGRACAEKSQGAIRHVPFKDGRCPFSGSNACTLELGERPLDCLTYPVYPEVGTKDDGGNELTGLLIRKGCHRVEEISEDKALLDLIRAFWKRELRAIKGPQMKEWLSGMAR